MGASIIIVVGFLICLAWMVIPRQNYDISTLESGVTTKSDVLRMWGKPEEVSHNEWVYTVPFKIYVSLDFDADGKLKSKYRSGPPVASDLP